MPVLKIGDSSAKTLESTLETPAEKKARLRSVFVAHASMFLSGFGNSLIYIGMYPYIVSVKRYCQAQVQVLSSKFKSKVQWKGTGTRADNIILLQLK